MKIIKKILLWLLVAMALLLAAAGIYIAVVAFTAKLDPEKLTSGEEAIHIFDANGNELDLYQRADGASYEELPVHTVNAFVSVEDKRFFSHRGVDYKRIAGAAWHNLKRRSLSEGGSTITQQLAKNTHLSRDKTFSRKIREIKLAYDIERRYTKQQILEMYLNKIYFGNGLYGIKNAARYYFDKEVSALTLPESAYLAGIVKAPSYYASQQHADKGAERKDLVLKLMRDVGNLDDDAYEKATAETLRFAESAAKNRMTAEYINCVILEASQALRCTEAELLQSRLSLHTYFDSDLQSTMRNIVLENKGNEHDTIAVVLDNDTHGVCAAYSTALQDIDAIRRQPGSVIKPVLPYASALEYGKITPATQILDEPCSFGGYAPKNFKNSYSGYISVRRALEKSSNIVAVKTLEYTGIDAAKTFAERLGLPLDEADDHLAIALGGLTKGFTVPELANAYSAFAGYGAYGEAKYIREIREENGAMLYRDLGQKQAAMREDTAFLITDMLTDVVRNGTARKLARLPYQVAAKTGTVGYENGNSDAWTIAYTSEHTVAVWCGKAAGGLMDGSVLGGTVPCEIARRTFETLYSSGTPADFQPPPTVAQIAFDKQDYERDHIIRLASIDTPRDCVLTDYFSLSNIPKETSSRFTEPEVKNASLTVCAAGIPVVKFDTEKYMTYLLYRTDEAGRQELIREISGKSGTLELYDRTISFAGIYEYTLIAEFESSDGTIRCGKPLTLGKVSVPAGTLPKRPDGLFDRILPFFQ